MRKVKWSFAPVMVLLSFALFAWAYMHNDGFSGVGGKAEYVRQRREVLHGLLRRAERIRDEEVYQHEVDSLERQLRELEAFAESVDEVGDEAKVTRRNVD